MKSKILVLVFVMIASLSGTIAQIDSQPFQIRMEHNDINKQLTGMKVSHTEREDVVTASIAGKAGVDSPYLKKDSFYITVDTNNIFPVGYKTKLPQALILPAIFIGWGVSVIGNHGLFSSKNARTDLLNFTKGKGGPIDNYLLFSPYAEFGMLILLKSKCNNDLINTTLLIVKSEALMLAIVEPLKYITHEQRPDKSDFYSMPSGHTAEAFVAAGIVYREYRHKSPWYGIGAYALATTVGVFRMVNDKHWESDVFVGAGIGMLSTNIVYATHQHRWGRNGVCFSPTYDGKNLCGLLSYQF